MTAGSHEPARRVVVVSTDGRVAEALAASINATPGLVATTVTGSPHAVDDAIGAASPDTVVVDVTRQGWARELRLVRRLARRLPVVAVSDSSCLCARAKSVGATCMCEKDGDPDALAAAVLAATGPESQAAATTTA